jgi:hypothetical protein
VGGRAFHPPPLEVIFSYRTVLLDDMCNRLQLKKIST